MAITEMTFSTNSNGVDAIQAIFTTHGVGSKKILLDRFSNSSGITQIAHTTIQDGEVIIPHRHIDMEEFFFILEGNVEFEIDNEKFLLTNNSFVFVPKGKMHGLKHTGLIPCKLISFSSLVR